MKKTNLILASSILTAAIAFSSCAPAKTEADDVTESINPTEVTALASPETNNTEYADLPDSTECVEASDENVLLIYNGMDGYSEFDYSYDITKTIIETVDESKVGTEKTVEFMGKQYKLLYERSRYGVLLSIKVDNYKIVEAEGEYADEIGYIDLLPDGTIYSITANPIFSIDIQSCKSGEDVRALVEESLKDEIDFSKYEHYSIAEPDEEAAFYFYSISWNNSIDNITLCDSAAVMVDTEGGIRGIRMKDRVDFGYDTLPDDLSLDDYLPQIESKLKKIYGEAFADYEVKSSFVGNIDGNLCIICDVDADYNDKQNEKTYDQLELAVFINQ
ncbi:MAG: hypothetical protein IKX58_09135 [Clostridia bacterium]|nr:hypothetical protein [Clostridia bacterium]